MRSPWERVQSAAEDDELAEATLLHGVSETIFGIPSAQQVVREAGAKRLRQALEERDARPVGVTVRHDHACGEGIVEHARFRRQRLVQRSHDSRILGRSAGLANVHTHLPRRHQVNRSWCEEARRAKPGLKRPLP
jgi:hypothetical protein